MGKLVMGNMMEAQCKPMHRRFYMPSEVALHNTPEDCWLSWFGEVYDLSPVLDQNKGHSLHTQSPPAHHANRGGHQAIHRQRRSGYHPLVRQQHEKCEHTIPLCIPLTSFLQLRERFGEDFVRLAYTPLGDVLHKPPSEPRSNWANNFKTPWWKDDNLKIAKLSQGFRQIRVVNTLTHQEHLLTVCAEETCEEILDRYLDYNKHAGSYTWKRLGNKLEMSKTLEENGVVDESNAMEELGLPDDYYVPALHLYFNDGASNALVG